MVGIKIRNWESIALYARVSIRLEADSLRNTSWVDGCSLKQKWSPAAPHKNDRKVRVGQKKHLSHIHRQTLTPPVWAWQHKQGTCLCLVLKSHSTGQVLLLLLRRLAQAMLRLQRCARAWWYLANNAYGRREKILCPAVPAVAEIIYSRMELHLKYFFFFFHLCYRDWRGNLSPVTLHYLKVCRIERWKNIAVKGLLRILQVALHAYEMNTIICIV